MNSLEYGRQWRATHPNYAKQYHQTHPLYNTWRSMKTRCFNPNNKAYKYYGGRGITVCQEWLDYNTFEVWALANGWEKGITIDRIDNDGDYESNNCQFIPNAINACKESRKPVNQFDISGNLITTYPSLREASRQTSINFSVIQGACTGHYKTAGGFLWRFVIA